MTEAAKNKVDIPDLDDIKEELATLRKDIAVLARHAGNGAMDKMSDHGHRIYERVQDGGERVVRAASHEIEERPLTSVLVAFAVGFVGGRLLAR
jgi:ElaB/YqjD/DUF883 family membrane-anchored ribosome-binding protein